MHLLYNVLNKFALRNQTVFFVSCFNAGDSALKAMCRKYYLMGILNVGIFYILADLLREKIENLSLECCDFCPFGVIRSGDNYWLVLTVFLNALSIVKSSCIIFTATWDSLNLAQTRHNSEVLGLWLKHELIEEAGSDLWYKLHNGFDVKYRLGGEITGETVLLDADTVYGTCQP